VKRRIGGALFYERSRVIDGKIGELNSHDDFPDLRLVLSDDTAGHTKEGTVARRERHGRGIEVRKQRLRESDSKALFIEVHGSPFHRETIHGHFTEKVSRQTNQPPSWPDIDSCDVVIVKHGCLSSMYD
jgi:hypothetical protein